MADIIDLLKELHYPFNEDGVCHGIALMAERARQRGKYSVFVKRMRFLNKIKKGTLLSLIKKAQLKYRNNLILNDDEEILLSIEPFFFELSAFQQPEDIARFLNIVNPYLHQSQFKTVEKLMEGALTSQDLKQPTNPADLLLTHGYSYFLHSNPNNKGRFIENFLTTIKEKGKKIGLVISSAYHTIHLFYDDENECWYLTEHSDITDYTSTKKLVKDIISIFSNNGIANLTFKVFTDSSFSLDSNLNTIGLDSTTSDEKFINLPDSHGDTAFQLAVKNNHPIIVRKLLVKNKSFLSQKDKMGRTPLWLAAEKGNVEMINILMEEKIDSIINTPDKDGASPLWAAAEAGYIDVVNILLGYDQIDVNKAYKNHITPLEIAVKNNHNMVVKALLNKNVDLNRVDKEGNSLLLVAASCGYHDIVESLLDKFDINKKNNIGFTALDLAIQNGHLKVVKLLLEKQKNNLSQINEQLDTTPLLLAIQHGHTRIVEYLIEQKADINQSNKNMTTPFELAVTMGHDKIVSTLLNYVPNEVNKVYKNNNTPLLLAAQNDNPRLIEVLMHSKATPNSINTQGETPLSIAVRKGHLKVVEALLKVEGIDKHKQNTLGITPLKAAVNLKKWDIVHALTSPIISKNLKQRLFTYVLSQERLTNEINQTKVAFFTNITKLLDKDTISFYTLIEALKKSDAKKLFSARNSVNSQSAKLVASLFAELGYPLNKQEMHKIVHGQIIETDIIKKANYRIINKWKSNPYHNSTKKYVEHEINILLGLNSPQNRGLSPPARLFNRYKYSFNSKDLLNDICIIKNMFPDYFSEFLFELSHQFEEEPAYIQAMTDFVVDKSETRKDLQLAMMNSHPYIAKAAILYEVLLDDEKPSKNPRDFFEIDSALQSKVAELMLKSNCSIAIAKLFDIRDEAEEKLNALNKLNEEKQAPALEVIQTYLYTLPAKHAKRSFFEKLKQAIDANGLSFELLQMNLNQVNHDMLFKKTFGSNSESKALQCIATLYQFTTNEKLDISNFLRTKTLPKKKLGAVDNLKYIIKEISSKIILPASNKEQTTESKTSIETNRTEQFLHHLLPVHNKTITPHILITKDKTKQMINEIHDLNREHVIKGESHHLSFLKHLISDKNRLNSEEKMMFEMGLLNYCHRYAAAFPPVMRKRMFDDYQSICGDYMNFLADKKYVPFNHSSQGKQVYRKMQTLKKLLLQNTNAIKSYSSDSLEELVFKALLKIMASEQCYDPKYYILVQSFSVFLDGNFQSFEPLKEQTQILKNVENLKVVNDDDNFLITLKHFIDGERSIVSLQEGLVTLHGPRAANEDDYSHSRFFHKKKSKDEKPKLLRRRTSLPNIKR